MTLLDLETGRGFGRTLSVSAFLLYSAVTLGAEQTGILLGVEFHRLETIENSPLLWKRLIAGGALTLLPSPLKLLEGDSVLEGAFILAEFVPNASPDCKLQFRIAHSGLADHLPEFRDDWVSLLRPLRWCEPPRRRNINVIWHGMYDPSAPALGALCTALDLEPAYNKLF